jgi:hypothetical protein
MVVFRPGRNEGRADGKGVLEILIRASADHLIKYRLPVANFWASSDVAGVAPTGNAAGTPGVMLQHCLRSSAPGLRPKAQPIIAGEELKAPKIVKASLVTATSPGRDKNTNAGRGRKAIVAKPGDTFKLRCHKYAFRFRSSKHDVS